MTASHVPRGPRRGRPDAPPPHRRRARCLFFQSLDTGRHRVSNDWKSRSGQALVESCLVVALIALILFGLLEISRLFMAREVLNYSATAGARAHAVGFNDFMVHKVARVAAIPTSGHMLSPGNAGTGAAGGFWRTLNPGRLWDLALTANPVSQQYETIERSRIPLYLGTDEWGQMQATLDYEHWEDLDIGSTQSGLDAVNTSVRQDVELTFPFHRAFYAADEVREAGDATMDGHYSLYLQ